MTVPLHTSWTQAEFFAWAADADSRYEFDGFRPVAMVGGTVNHARIGRNIQLALGSRLRGTPCEPLGPDAGVETANNAVRYPDVLVTCSKGPGDAYTVPGVVVVFEVVSPTSSRIDRIVKVREYAAVGTIQRYVIVESTSVGLTVFDRQSADETWRGTTLTEGEVLRMPEIGIEVPVAEFYDGVSFSEERTAGA